MSFRCITLISAFASLFSNLPTTAAIPNVTAVQLPDGCSYFPGYNATTGIAGPWLVEAVDTDNTAIEGFTDTSLTFSDSSFNIILLADNAGTKTPLQCSDADYVWGLEGNNSTKWASLALLDYLPNAVLSSTRTALGHRPARLFEHYIDGQKQAGSFLGQWNSTVWAFLWKPGDSESGGKDYYLPRVLLDGQALQANETAGFIKIVA